MVTREQMAVFVLRTLDPAINPPAWRDAYLQRRSRDERVLPLDEELIRRSVVSGCGGSNYCPTAAVTREQMGVFMSATFGLTFYGP